MDGEATVGCFALVLFSYFLPTIIVLIRRHPDAGSIALLNLLFGWTGIGWWRAFWDSVGKIDVATPRWDSVTPEEVSEPRPEHQYTDLASRLLELPPANRVLSLQSGDGREIQLVTDSSRPLTLRLAGTWTADEEAAAGALMQAEADSRPDLVRLLDAEDPIQGVVFTAENRFSVSDLVYRLITEALAADPVGFTVDKNYEDHDARPAIIAVLDEQRSAEIFHEESGVRVQVTLSSPAGYSLAVPTAALDPRRGQRHRARTVISDTCWRLYDGDTGSSPAPEDPVDDSASSWGYSVYRGDSKEAANAALRLLCTIADLPIDVRVSVLPPSLPDLGCGRAS